MKQLYRVVMTMTTEVEWFVEASSAREAKRIGPALDMEHGQEEILRTAYKAEPVEASPEDVRHVCTQCYRLEDIQ